MKDGLQVIHPNRVWLELLLPKYLLCQCYHQQENEITEGNEAEINQLVGEAYFMRGYMHFLLVNLYGQPYTKKERQLAKPFH